MKKLTGIYWVKDEARYLPEYIEFHLLQGFDHFIFYDNGSTDKTFEVMEPYIQEGLVEIRTYPPGISRHNFWLMQHCIDEQKNKSKWIHFHAIDERIYSPTGRQLPEVLEEYDQPHIGGVCVGWTNLHSGGKTHRPEGLIIENFTLGQTVDPSYHIKTIINPLKTSSQMPHHPHNFIYLPSFVSVNENYGTVNGPFDSGAYTFQKFRNFHFGTMSREEFEIKMNKGLLDHAGQEFIRRRDAEIGWQNYHGHGSDEYTQLLQFVPAVRENLAKRFQGREHLLPFINH